MVKAGFLGDIGKRAIAVVAIEDVLTVVADEEVVPTVVVVVTDTATLTPTGSTETGLDSDIGKSAITIIFEEARNGFLAFGEALETCAVDEEDV